VAGHSASSWPAFPMTISSSQVLDFVSSFQKKGRGKLFQIGVSGVGIFQ
jgi:hypothetical protein